MSVQRDSEFLGVASFFVGSCGEQMRWYDSSLERECGVPVCEVENVVA